jgi:pimeloyl-ACP methyl ester carboxylesterase
MRGTWRALALLGGAAVLGGLAGCGGTGQPHVTPQRLDRGLVLVLPGIHGRLWLSENLGNGLAAGGVDQAIEIYDWTQPVGNWCVFYNLMAVEHNREIAARIAHYITDYQAAHPGRPVTLVGYSGGGPMAVYIAEAMPAGACVDAIFLLSAPLTKTYPLEKALAASRKGILSIYSNRDLAYLGMGTLLFGTMDGKHEISAGNVRFETPAGGPGADLYRKLFQVSWEPWMDKLGYTGSHLSSASPPFVAAYLAPLIRADRWNSDLFTRLGAADTGSQHATR